ncbi:MAG: KH domain-containing protein [Chlamydiales bacterium]|nr:KH domain-containing protein [Chlamydiia bacterium]MCP5507265.1 KH domain-containing protein [Chlamydiales bacterium]
MKEFIEYIVKNLVDEPDLVDVRCFQEEKGLLVEIRVGDSDVGKVVGKRGATIGAIRTICTTISARLGHRVRIKLIDAEEPASVAQE